MQKVSIKNQYGNFIDDEELLYRLLPLHKNQTIHYKDTVIRLIDISRYDDRDYLHISIEGLHPVAKELHDNIDRVERHNIGGTMNRPSDMQVIAADYKKDMDTGL